MGPDPKLLEYANRIIHHKARQLVLESGFSPSDREDIEQELRIAILERWKAFDSRRASDRTFAARIIENKAVSLIRANRAAKRNIRRCTPLYNERVTDGDFDEERARSRRGIHSRSALESLSLRLDVAALLADLPKDLRCVSEQLLLGSVSDACRRSGKHRSTIYRAIHDLREYFAQAGLEKYL
ncbi:MAG: sigma factor [Planctomycetota bacterium]